jgi:hypothetical protein
MRKNELKQVTPGNVLSVVLCERGVDHQQARMYSYISPEERVRADHPLRAIRAMADTALKNMSEKFAAM